MDTALTPVDEADTDDLALFQTAEAKTYVVQQRRLAAIRASVPTFISPKFFT